MTIGSKNHYATNATAIVSAASRSDARPAVLKFADHHQEKAFWVTEKLRLQRELADLNTEMRRELAKASGEARGAQEWFVCKSAVENAHSLKRKDLIEQINQVETKLQAAKVKVKQENDRVWNAEQVTKSNSSGPILMAQLLDEAKKTNLLLQSLIETIKQKGSPNEEDQSQQARHHETK